MKNHYNIYRVAIASCLAAFYMAGCGTKSEPAVVDQPEVAKPALVIEKQAEPVTVERLTPQGPVYNIIKDQPVPAPDYLRIGVEHSKVAELQQRLMDLGFMDYDEPTNYYGKVTEAAIKLYQRQSELAMDGIVGSATWDSIMDTEAKHYAVAKGVQGDDIARIQQRLYELGYLPSADLVTGSYGDTTESSVMKLQEVNSLKVDGKVGQQTMNLLYSDEIKPNMLAYGEKSEVVLACQNLLKNLGYLTTDPDGSYGNDTSLAVKQFQSRNDLVVDGYLGPSTRIALESSTAIPNGIGLGEEGDSVKRVQQLLSTYGYLASANVTGYFGDVTERAVKSFQTQNGLSADGSVGRMTMAKLSGSDVKRAPAGGGSSSSGSRPSSGGSSGSRPSTGQSGSSGGGTVVTGSGASGLIAIASSKIGSPYVWGAKGPNSFDCSGFIYWCLNQAGVRQSYLTSSGWRSVGKYTKISSFSSLQPGDIIVVKGHVGIVAGGGTVIDASSSNGRVVHRSLSGWWQNNFICGWRIF